MIYNLFRIASSFRIVCNFLYKKCISWRIFRNVCNILVLVAAVYDFFHYDTVLDSPYPNEVDFLKQKSLNVSSMIKKERKCKTNKPHIYKSIPKQRFSFNVYCRTFFCLKFIKANRQKHWWKFFGKSRQHCI